MDPKNKFSTDVVATLQHALEQVPPYQPTHLSKQQTIGILAPQLYALRSKGYSWGAVAAMVSEKGVPVTAAVLRTYLRRVHPRDVPRNQSARPKQQPCNVQGGAKHSVPATLAAPSRTPHANVADIASRMPPREQDPSSRRSAFEVRPDTKDL
jgi:hypothetical protein